MSCALTAFPPAVSFTKRTRLWLISFSPRTSLEKYPFGSPELLYVPDRFDNFACGRKSTLLSGAEFIAQELSRKRKGNSRRKLVFLFGRMARIFLKFSWRCSGH
ncbi:hypothetical protein [Candidatus Electronema sp. JM]|uniref:hypothetical protein n=1 Tax=Candidatus Electronema sp. JM TaxID=3401571 RepID=UPI003AA8FCCB